MYRGVLDSVGTLHRQRIIYVILRNSTSNSGSDQHQAPGALVLVVYGVIWTTTSL